MSKVLTKRQFEIYKFIKDSKALRDYCPSIREIAKEFNISIKGAYDHLTAIKKKGHIDWQKQKSRTYRIIEEGAEKREIARNETIYDVIRWFILNKKDEYFTKDDIEMVYEDYMEDRE